jgi:hypothetical protein
MQCLQASALIVRGFFAAAAASRENSSRSACFVSEKAHLTPSGARRAVVGQSSRSTFCERAFAPHDGPVIKIASLRLEARLSSPSALRILSPNINHDLLKRRNYSPSVRSLAAAPVARQTTPPSMLSTTARSCVKTSARFSGLHSLLH